MKQKRGRPLCKDVWLVSVCSWLTMKTTRHVLSDIVVRGIHNIDHLSIPLIEAHTAHWTSADSQNTGSAASIRDGLARIFRGRPKVFAPEARYALLSNALDCPCSGRMT
jgi:hypothetical protein